MKKLVNFLRNIFISVELLLRKEVKYVFILCALYILGALISFINLLSIYPLLLILQNKKYNIPKSLENYISNFEENDYLLFLVLVILFSSLFLFFLKIISEFLKNKYLLKLRLRLSKDILNSLAMMPHLWWQNRQKAKLLRHIQHDIGIWAKTIVEPLIGLAEAFLFILGPTILAIYYIKIKYLIVLIPFILILYLVIFYSRRYVNRFANEENQYALKSSSNIYNLLEGIREIKVFGVINTHISRVIESIEKHTASYAKKRITILIPGIFLMLISFWALGLSILSIILFELDKSELLTVIIFLGVLATRIIPQVTGLISKINMLISNSPFIENLIKLLKDLNINKVKELKNAKLSVLSKINKITFTYIGFRYANSKKKILNNLNFSLEKGKIYGLIGESGSGKTSLINIILGLILQTEGKIMLNKQEVNIFNNEEWFKKIAYIPQEPFLFDTSLIENITLGSKELDKRLINSLVENLDIKKFLNKRIENENNNLGDRGFSLSGGEKKRVILARALCRKPEFILLDEATAGLDKLSEKLVYNLLSKIKKETSILIVSHDINSLNFCDYIFNLKNGHVKVTKKI